MLVQFCGFSDSKRRRGTSHRLEEGIGASPEAGLFLALELELAKAHGKSIQAFRPP